MRTKATTTFAIVAMAVAAGMIHFLTDLQNNQLIASSGSKVATTDRRRQRIAILHVGPRKTGTTTIQKSLFKAAARMEQDGFALVGQNMGPWWYMQARNYMDLACFSHNATRANPRCAKGARAFAQFQAHVRDLSKSSKSIIYSDEDLSRFSITNPDVLDLLLEQVFGDYDECRITLTYRHFAEWYLSEYNQQQRSQSHTKPLLGFVDWHRRNSPKDWFLNAVTKVHVREYEKRLGTPVLIYNMHTSKYSNNLAADWLATVAPEATGTIRSNATVPFAANPSHDNLEGRRLAQALLLDHGHFLNQVSSRDFGILSETIQQWLNDYAIGAPNSNVGSSANFSVTSPIQVCLTDEENQDIWTRTLQRRDDLVADYDPTNASVRASFEQAVRHFCQVDYEKLKECEAWQVFVDGLDI